MIPFHSLKFQIQNLQPELNKIWEQTLNDQRFIGGAAVKDFEKKFQSKINAKHCISCANGTDAIYAVLKALDIGPGDEVITVTNTWISSSEVINQVGAQVVFADIDEFHTISILDVKRKITSKTKAIIAVHLYGQACDLDSLVNICEEHNIYLIEDCAQAHFTKYRGKYVGNFGIAGTFSFYPGKNLGAFGDAGAIISNDNKLAEKLELLVRHGAKVKHDHIIEGFNSRLDTLQARILSLKLDFILDWNKQRQDLTLDYIKNLIDEVNIKLIPIRPETEHSWHVFVVMVNNRNNLIAYLLEHGIETAIHYPKPLYDQPCYKNYALSREYQETEETKEKILSLPLFPEMKKEDILIVCNRIKEFYANN